MDDARGTGRTTSQMKEAPKDSFFIVLNTHWMVYSTALARHLGRGDLVFVPVDMVDTLRGRNLTGLTVDHAVWDLLSPRDHDMLRREMSTHLARIRQAT